MIDRFPFGTYTLLLPPLRGPSARWKGTARLPSLLPNGPPVFFVFFFEKTHCVSPPASSASNGTHDAICCAATV
ncbi:hypothetical protein CAEBREN_07241 [Caenorhabditis brenneri]|uniref:Uncharacterized protein n=1 Tax=Caenorhabditis brenneri TaxID=135651 RepID=G0MGB0_CAEBE|nr:hypothetical protein CAEBREN_07241 [Caenorhabditis brenneri]